MPMQKLVDAAPRRSSSHKYALRLLRVRNMEELMQTTTFKIEGMHCEGCAQTIQALVERERGVKAAAISFNCAPQIVV